MNKNNQIPDRIFREKLEGLSVPPPPDTFEKIQARLKNKKRKAVFFWYRTVAAAAVIVFGLIAGYNILDNKNNIPETNKISEVNTKVPQAENNLVKEKTENEAPVENTETSENITLVATANQNVATSNKVSENKQIDSENLTSEVLTRETNHLNILQRIQILLKTNEPSGKLAPVQNKIPQTVISNYERELIALNTSAANNHKEENKWGIGFRISPGYSSQNSDHSEFYSQNMTYSNTEGSSDLTGGFSVEYKAAKRLSIESGVYYSQNGQQSGNSPLLYGDYLMASPSKESAVDYFNTPVEIKDGTMLMNSTAGVIVFKETPENAELSANLSRNDSYSNALLTESEFSQVFDFIEIPVLLKYNIIDQKIAIDLVGGFSANWVVGNSVYIGEGTDREYVGKTSDISTLNYSGTFGFGVDYAIGKRLSLSVEPRLNYFLNSINKNNAVDYKPYRVGVYTGINYNF